MPTYANNIQCCCVLRCVPIWNIILNHFVTVGPLLPKLLYLYWALPIQVPPSFFIVVKHALSTLTWQGKRPRGPYHILIRHKRVGGMGLLDLKDYYVAVVLDQLRHWFAPSDTKQWKAIKQYFKPFGQLSSLILAQSLFKAFPSTT